MLVGSRQPKSRVKTSCVFRLSFLFLIQTLLSRSAWVISSAGKRRQQAIGLSGHNRLLKRNNIFKLFQSAPQRSPTTMALVTGAKVLFVGDHGSLWKIPLEKAPVKSTLRPGEESTVFTRLLSTIQFDTSKKNSALSLHRFKVWWLRPKFGRPIPPETLLLLDRVEDNTNNFRLVLPVVLPLENGNAFASASVQGLPTGLKDEEQLILCSNHNETGVYIGIGQDPYALVQEGVTLATDLWKDSSSASKTPVLPYTTTGQTRPSNNVAVDKLGWCTWNAFYTDLNGSRIVEAVRSLQHDHDIPVRWMIIDDGWQHITTSSDDTERKKKDVESNGFQWSQRLQSCREDPLKFQDLSLKDTIQRLRNDFGMKVWIWHTLAGYWVGINPDSPSFEGTTKMQYAHFPPGIIDNDASALMEPSVDKGVGITTNPTDFFQQYHSKFLRNICGVDGIKVDAQGVVGTLKPYKSSERKETVVSASNNGIRAPVIALHDALASSVEENFCCPTSSPVQNRPGAKIARQKQSPSIIHCMAHAPEIFYRLPSLYLQGETYYTQAHQLPLFRVADDFYPDNPHSHGPQIVACAYNSLLFQHVAHPDWDMFATGSDVSPEFVQCHVVARCISGGPIYFSSSPADLHTSKGRPEWIDWICCADGSTLPCRGPAVPVESCLLQDPLAPNAAPLILRNTNGNGITCTRNHDEQQSGCSVTSGVLGVFHLAGCGRWDYDKLDYVSNLGGDNSSSILTKEVSICLDMLPQLSGNNTISTKFLATRFFSRSVQVLSTSKSTMTFTLGRLQSEFVTIHPILEWSRKNDVHEVAVLGFEGRVNAAGAVESIRCHDNKPIEIVVRGCGMFLIVSRPVIGNNSVRSAIEGGGNLSIVIDEVKVDHIVLANMEEELAEEHYDDSTKPLRNELARLGFSLLTFEVAACEHASNLTHRIKVDLIV